MRSRSLVFLLLILASLLAACGSQPAAEQPIAEASLPAATSTPTSAPTATPNPPTATAAPTATPIPPTATAAPTAEPTAEPTAAPASSAAATVAPEVVASDVSDTAHLDESAGVQTETVPVAAVNPAQPVRLRIPSIKLDYKPVSVGLDKNRVPIVLKHDVGWYNLSAMPGQGENIVFWGHVLRFKAAPKIPAPFARIKELKPGALVFVTTAKGQEVQYKVVKSVQVKPSEVQYILPVGKEQVTLVSCIGDNVITSGELTKQYRLITIAEPVR